MRHFASKLSKTFCNESDFLSPVHDLIDLQLKSKSIFYVVIYEDPLAPADKNTQ